MDKLLPNHAIRSCPRLAPIRTACICASLHPPSRKPFSTSRPSKDDDRQEASYGHSNESRNRPRWATTPTRMTAPVRSKPPVMNNDFHVNEDPQKLDRVYNRVLGRSGDKMLTEEVKWLAVTHKSFDHGRRGYNERLAFLGMILIVKLRQRDMSVCAETVKFQGRDSSSYRLH